MIVCVRGRERGRWGGGGGRGVLKGSSVRRVKGGRDRGEGAYPRTNTRIRGRWRRGEEVEDRRKQVADEGRETRLRNAAKRRQKW